MLTLWGVVVLYLAVLMAIGLWTAGQQRSTLEFFLAGRRLAWWAVGMSMYASVTSAVTFMGVPSQGWAGNLSLILVGAVSVVTAPVLAGVIFPAYRRAGVTTSYELLGRRFGTGARRMAALLFLAARVSWLGLAIYAPSLALATATRIPLACAVVVIGGLATLYTAMGGLAAVVWTDVVQFAVMVGGLAWLIIVLAIQGGAGPAAVWSRA